VTLLYNKSPSKHLRKKLRNNMPTPEIVLWQHLRNRQINGYKFRRQAGIGNYIVDFYCPKLKLVIEIDGDSHFESNSAIQKDKERQQKIQNNGIKFLRFTNTDITENIEGVIAKISDVTRPASDLP
jgi:very-short-patch-repair endonuclease